MARKRVAVLISGRGSNMAALVEAAKDSSYPAEIALVVSNRPQAEGIAYARRAGIATTIIDHADYGKNRKAFEQALQAVLEGNGIEIICLAGFMRLLTPWFIDRWQGRMLNIHPALLPKFKGLHTHEQALSAGAKEHGATVHFVTADMDAGPIVCQASVPVQKDDTAETLAARVLTVEHKIYPLALKWLAEGSLRINEGTCRLDGAQVPDGVTIPTRV
ncbi:MAG: phosphoribosylglycinamide formyltransferase 1 [Alphaproteobacteria bacterium]|jgi:phosphoribosylglycinamide formyltransferase-1|nr:phosphoribosylglycinamide formyltransferase 1 [Alphaproteobacteria bacterium]